MTKVKRLLSLALALTMMITIFPAWEMASKEPAIIKMQNDVKGKKDVTPGDSVTLTTELKLGKKTYSKAEWKPVTGGKIEPDKTGRTAKLKIDSNFSGTAIKVQVDIYTVEDGKTPTASASYSVAVKQAEQKAKTSNFVNFYSNNKSVLQPSSVAPQTANALTVDSVPVTGITFETTKSVKVGDTGNFSAQVEPAEATEKGITYTSSSPAVLEVTPEGAYTAKSVGEAKVTATAKDTTNSITAECTVTVSAADPATVIAFDPAAYTVKIGETVNTTLKKTPAEATDTITYVSSNDNIAIVNASGVVTGVAKGTVTITASADGVTPAECTVEVLQPVTGINLTTKSLDVKVGDTGNIVAAVVPLDASNTGIKYTSSDTSVITVNESTGAYEAIKAGTTTITAKTVDGDFEDICNVTVSDADPATVIVFESDTYTVEVNKTVSTVLKKTPADATDVITYESSSPSIATVNETTGAVTGVTKGKTTITASADGVTSATCEVTVEDPVVNVTGVSLAPESVTLEPNGTSTLTATVEPSNASNKKITFSTSDANIAEITSNTDTTALITGKLPDGKKIATATITVTTEDQGLTDVCLVTVKASDYVELTDIELDKVKESDKFYVGESLAIKTTLTPANAVVDLEYKSSDNTIATVDNTGKITGVKAGNAKITVEDNYTGKTAELNIVVEDKDIPVTSITIDNTGTALEVEVGKSIQVNTTITPSTATNKKLNYSVDANATIDADGKLTGTKAGKAVVTVTWDGDASVKTNKEFTVKAATQVVEPTSVKFTSGSTLSIKAGSTSELKWEFEPANTTEKAVTFKSSKESFATVSDKGVVTAKAVGSTEITITTSNGKTDKCTVNVTSADVPVTGVKFTTASTIRMSRYEYYYLGYEVRPSGATNKKVTFTTSDSDVATVDSSGRVYAARNGTATITVKTDDGSYKDTCTIIVGRVTPTDVYFRHSSVTIYDNEYVQLDWYFTPSNTTEKDVRFTSSDTYVATVDSNGYVRGRNPGRTTITIRDDYGHSDTMTVRVTDYYGDSGSPSPGPGGSSSSSSISAITVGRNTELRANDFNTRSDYAYIYPYERSSDLYEAEIRNSVLETLHDRNDDYKLIFSADGVTLDVPANIADISSEFKSIINDHNISRDNASIKVTIDRSRSNKNAESALNRNFPKAKAIGEFTDFKIEVVNNRTDRVIGELKNFSTPLERTIKFSGSLPSYYGVFKYDSDSGDIRFVPHKKDGNKLLLTSNTNSVYFAAENRVVFSDVVSGPWYTYYVENAAAKGLVYGVGNNRYEPDRSVSRGEFVNMVVNALGLGDTGSSSLPYNDVKKSDWYYNAVKIAYNAGLLDRIGGANFSANSAITREEMASITAQALRYMDYNKSGSNINVSLAFPYDYFNIENKYLEDVKLVYDTQIMVGMGGGYYSPKSYTTRGQAAKVQYQLLKVLDLID